MRTKCRSYGLVVLAAAALCAAPRVFAEDDGSLSSAGPLLWQPSMNVFRRFDAAQEEMFEFYGEVLGLTPLETYDVGGGTRVARFRAGGSVIKLTRRVGDRQYIEGGVRDATGVRLLTFFFPARPALIERFREHGYDAPEFVPLPGSTREAALVTDPDGQWVELVIAPGEPEGTYEQIEVGLTVADIERSREFYREFVGLEELAPAPDPLFGTTKYPYRHGTTTVNLRSFGAGLPKDTGSGGIQYVVTHVEAVDALAQARGVVIDQPLSVLRGFGVQTIWLDDPDGITNYFAETAASRRAAAKREGE